VWVAISLRDGESGFKYGEKDNSRHLLDQEQPRLSLQSLALPFGHALAASFNAGRRSLRIPVLNSERPVQFEYSDGIVTNQFLSDGRGKSKCINLFQRGRRLLQRKIRGPDNFVTPAKPRIPPFFLYIRNNGLVPEPGWRDVGTNIEILILNRQRYKFFFPWVSAVKGDDSQCGEIVRNLVNPDRARHNP
jgi:hypothetical protein